MLYDDSLQCSFLAAFAIGVDTSHRARHAVQPSAPRPRRPLSTRHWSTCLVSMRMVFTQVGTYSASLLPPACTGASPTDWSSSRRSSSSRRCGSHAIQADQTTPYSVDSVTSKVYEEEQYESTIQSEQRKSWRASVRCATGRQHHLVWEPSLDPPALLSHVCVVLVGPKKPVSCGVAARACSCFECEDLRFVQPRCDHLSRSSRSVSKGAQYILHRAQLHDTLPAALADCDLSLAFTRWLPELQHKAVPDIPRLLAQPIVQQLLQQPHTPLCSSNRRGESSSQAGGQVPVQQLHQLHQASRSNDSSSSDWEQGHGQQPWPVRIALVFGREEYGLSDDEVAACDLACAISIGRLQESVSLSHAVSIVLAQLYQARLSAVASASAVAILDLPYSVRSVSGLADGYDSSSGTEH